jgi:hypothetical protein
MKASALGQDQIKSDRQNAARSAAAQPGLVAPQALDLFSFL